MVDGKLLHRIVVWPTYEDAAAAEADAASEDCKHSNKLTVWQTYEQAAAHTHFDDEGGGGGGDAYVAQAVHFDGPAFENQITGAAEMSGTKWMSSYWFKIDNINGSPTPLSDVGYNWATIGWNDLGDIFQALGIANDEDNTRFRFSSDPGLVTVDVWHHLAISADTDFPAGSKIGQMYLDGVDVLNPALTEDNSDAFAFLTSPPFGMPEDGINGSIELAAVQLWIGIRADLSEPANLAKLISGGKPVDPAIAAAEFGEQTLLFDGDADGFIVNQGTGGAFALTGSVTNASTSPSD